MKIFFLGIPVTYLCGNIYVFIRGLQLLKWCFPLGRGPLNFSIAVYSILFWLAAVSLFVSLLARNVDLPYGLHRALYNIGSVWMVFTLYMVLSLLAVDLLKLFVHPLTVWGTPVALLFTVVLLVCGYINYRNPRIEEISVNVRSSEEDGSSIMTQHKLKTLKIAALSDVHLGHSTGKKDLLRYVELINSQHPDIILIGGDLIDNSLAPLVDQHMEEELGMLSAPMGIYMVPGNHEYISGIEESVEFLQKTPVKLLRDSVVVLPCGVQILGRDDRSNRERESVADIMSKVQDGMPVIMIDHQPYEVELKDSLGVALQFSGHTHRGQVWPLSLLVDRMYEQSYGYRQWANSHVIVSCGLSLWGPPFRIGTSSDLWVINFQW